MNNVDCAHTVHSSGGTFFIAADGSVIKADIDPADCDDLKSITRFNLPEWSSHWKRPLPDSFDILDLGCWRGEVYEEPCHTWRDDVRPQRKS